MTTTFFTRTTALKGAVAAAALLAVVDSAHGRQGMYANLNTGYGLTHNKMTIANTGAFDRDQHNSGDGMMGGVALGYVPQAWRKGSLYFGAEAFGNMGKLEGKEMLDGAGQSMVTQKMEYAYGFLALIGYDFGEKARLVTKAGWAFTEWKSHFSMVRAGQPLSGDEKKNVSGMRLELGGEFDVSDNLAFTTGVAYTAFKKYTERYTGGATIQRRPSIMEAKIGLSYYFSV